ncbi:quinohemoprotein amine dehydrogenase [Hydrogenophaga palleronii]|uniref:Quinohemoprotein amine dehydrogenase n=1 Tax=Hydrogenophaga palleronii TaxID=65655 RepID=A0ABU1WTY4_9BURK|nr:quinohemoprotein amine dehydrogenase subunit alpha [Hydrogenophaga palleronii]MDR7152757.1 quinohemoprotein amine dehydrogenase [Hydrogenophaga palleronii]
MNWKHKLRSLAPLGAAFVWLAAMPTAGAATLSAQEIINTKCVACHTKTGEQVNRLQQRKTPEGWLMTITRMRTLHHADLTAEEVRTVVKHLADTQGLAPSETQGARYAMERRLNTIEQHKSELFGQMCARCHSGARVELQRRPMAEWEHLVHFHVGQFPTIEYQALGRDRDWVNIAFKEMVPYLTKNYPYESKAWTDWKARAPVNPVGRWTVAGRWPGKGEYAGVMAVAAGASADRYTVSLDGTWADGSELKGSGPALVYTGYEWRADLDVDGVKMRQVLALDGDRASGRMFEREQEESGGDLVAARHDAGAQVLALQPALIRAGETATLRIVGTGLDGEVKLPQGLQLVETVSRDPQQVVLKVAAAKSAPRGLKNLTVGAAPAVKLAVFDRIDYVKVTPDYAIGRVGGSGGSTPVVQGRFEAVAYSAGPDRKPGTKDDWVIGVVPAKWSVEPFDDTAKNDRDVEFAGLMNVDTGVFIPGGAGPNPKRRMSTNNAGNLNAVATVTEGKKTLTGKAHFIVTVQRWNNPPLP